MIAQTVGWLVRGIALATTFATTAAGQPAARSPLWGRLEAGRHSVGFRQLLLRDVSRPAVAADDGSIVDSGRGRQMQIAVWYPATGRATTPMRYGDYVDRLAQELDFRPITDTARRRAIEKFFEMPVGFGGDTAGLRRVLPRLLAIHAAATVNARPALGRFPVVLFPEYRAPASNSVMAEYLASHGFVVATAER